MLDCNKKGILERVPPGEVNRWCYRMMLQSKKNGKIRRTADLSYLIRAGIHESHYNRSAAEVAKSVPAGKLNPS